MGPSARVGSIEKLQALHDALARFAVEAQGALDAGRTAIRRALDGLHDALRRWQVEVQRRQEEVNRARADLSHSRAIRQGEAGRAGTVEQEIALQKARQRLQEAEEKVERTRRWLRLLPDALAEVETPSRHLAGLLESDLRQALALLDGKIAALTAYAELAARETGKGGP
ncbi:MAG TPA: hypothetical protein VFE78_06285 [Gemmataceae bacterium]|jgi:chromosome segregation ATPase|nr:hypothetical protein [Gemmataceae bacterium]